MEITGKTPTEAPYGMHTYVCPECGKHHEVKLRCVNDAIEVSSLEEDTCRGFKEKVNAFIKTEVRRHLNDPLPYLR